MGIGREVVVIEIIDWELGIESRYFDFIAHGFETLAVS